MAFDKHANLIKVTVTVAPSPATTGITLSISNADATALTTAGLTAPFNMLAQPISGATETNVEIIRVTAIGAADSGGVGNAQLTITRTAETQPGSARSIIIGDYLTNNTTAKTLTDIETYTPAYLANATPTANNIPVLDATAGIPQAAYLGGWVNPNVTWVYATASTFTIAGVDLTAVFTKGTRLKWTDSGGVKYGVVISSSFSTNTTVTIAVNNDYTIANSAITLNYYSYQANPQGYPGWFAFTTTITGLTLSTALLRYNIIGNMCLIRLLTVYGTSNATGFTFTVPVAALVTNNGGGNAFGEDNSVLLTTVCNIEFTTTITFNAYKSFYNTPWTATGTKALWGDFEYEF